MITPEDPRFDSLNVEEDELVRRLEHLQWPTVRTEVRQRCWEEFSRRLAEETADRERSAFEFSRRDTIDFSRRSSRRDRQAGAAIALRRRFA